MKTIPKNPFLILLFFLFSFFDSATAQLNADQQFELADSFRLQMQFAEASKLYNQADSLFALAENTRGQIKVGIAQSRMDLVNRAYAEANKRVTDLIAIAQQANIQGLELASCYNILGAIAGEKESEYHLALQYHLQAIQELSRDSSKAYLQTRARTLGTIGTCYEHLGDFDSAMEKYTEATDLLKEVYGSVHMAVAIGHRSRASILSRRGFYKQGIAAYEAALKIHEVVLPKSHPLKLTVQQGIGDNYLALGHFEKALDWYTQSEIMATALFGPSSADVAIAYHNQGKVYQAMGDSNNALDYFQRARATLVTVFGADKSQLVAVYSDIANILLKKGKTNLALNNEEKALELNLKIYGPTHPFVAANYRQLGDILSVQNKTIAAASYYKKAMYIFNDVFTGKHPEKAVTFLSWAHSAELQGDITKSLQLSQQALIQLVAGFDQQEVDQLPDLEEIDGRPIILEIISLKMNLLFQKYNTDKKERDLQDAYTHAQFGIAYINQVIPHLDKGRTQNFWLEQAFPFYETALDIIHPSYQQHPNQRDFWNGFQITDQSKSTLLLQHLQLSDAQINGGVPDSLIKREETLINDLNFYRFLIETAAPDEKTAKVNFWKQELLNTKNKYQVFTERLNNNYPRYAQLKFKHTLNDFSALTSTLKGSEEVIVNYFLGQQRLHIFVVHPDQTAWIATPVDTSFQQQVISFIRLCSNQNLWLQNPKESLNSMTEQGHQLYSLLLADALSGLANDVNQLILILDGVLGYLPFELLIPQLENTTDIKSTNWLIKTFNIQYHYQAAILLNEKTKKRKASQPYLGFTVDYQQLDNPDQFVALPAAIEEVNAAEKIWGGTSFVNEKDLEQLFKQEAPDAQILHLALHAHIEDEHPQYSKFLFGETNSLNDNQLHTYEIYNLPLNAELAVLSACNTGRGKLQRGEGIMSLARGFRYAGVPAITMSLWNVNDVSSKDIILSYFQYLKTGKEKHEALRQAKLDYINHQNKLLSPPYYWAGFVHIGDVSEIHLKDNSWRWLYGVLFIVGMLVVWIVRRRW